MTLHRDRTDPPGDPIDAWNAIRLLIIAPPRLSYADYDTGNYHSDRRLYETHKKQTTRDRSAALAVLADAIGRPYNRAALAYACAHTRDGRITWSTTGELEYCAGQYGAIERRAAILSVLRSYLDIITGPSFSIGSDGRMYSQSNA